MDKRWLIFGIGMILLVLTIFFYAPGNTNSITSLVVQAPEDDLASQELSEESVISKETVMNELGKIIDPEIDVPLVEVIGLTSDAVKIENGKVTVIINLPSHCPLKEKIFLNVEEQLIAIQGVETVEVRSKDEISEEERENLDKRDLEYQKKYNQYKSTAYEDDIYASIEDEFEAEEFEQEEAGQQENNNNDFSYEIITPAQVNKNVNAEDLIPDELASDLINWENYKVFSKQELNQKVKGRGLDIKHDYQLDELDNDYPKLIKQATLDINQAQSRNDDNDLIHLREYLDRIKDKYACVLIEKEIRKNKAFERSPIGTTYYIDYVGGSNGAAGTHTSTAWKTLPQFTTTTARSAGDIAYVRAGQEHVYDTSNVVIDESGALNNNIQIIGCNSSLDPWNDSSDVKTNITFQGADYQMYIYGLSYWDFVNLVFKNSSDIYGAFYTSSNTQINFKNCVFRDIDGVPGIYVRRGKRISFENCEFYNINGSAIYNTVSRMRVVNTKIDPGSGSASYGIYNNEGKTTIIDSNITSGAAGIRFSAAAIIESRNFIISGTSASIHSSSYGGKWLAEDWNGTLGAHRSYYSHNAYVEKDTSVTRTGGANSSAKMVMGNSMGINNPLTLTDSITTGDFKLWLQKNMTYRVSIYLRGYGWSSFPISNHLYTEASYYDTASGTSRYEVRSTQVISDNSNWVGFNTTFTPAQTGWVYVTVNLAKYEADAGIYADIKPVVSVI